MASYRSSYGTAAEEPGSPDNLGGVEEAARLLLSELITYLAPRVRRARKFLITELIRVSIAVAALAFALVAGVYGTIYFFAFLTELFTRWMPHWAALGAVAAIMLVPAAGAAVLGLWQIYRMRTVRAATGAAAQASAVVRDFARQDPHAAKGFRAERHRREPVRG
ncbi:phage holin family protein [Nocardia jejuensis]|uniref:phage holin family protein n=1 Tax=Nocardia jejuensis TaxID=328049 RepID=UPI000830D591|nr:phage holin family protein [Nocardia jejuensis]